MGAAEAALFRAFTAQNLVCTYHLYWWDDMASIILHVFMLAEKMKDVSVATTRSRQQGDPKASGIRPTGVKGLSFVAAGGFSLRPVFLWQYHRGFHIQTTATFAEKIAKPGCANAGTQGAAV